MSWSSFGSEIRKRFFQSWSNEKFVGYFVSFIVVVGALGVFISIFEYANTCNAYKIAFSMGTYSIAITATAFVDLNLSRRVKQKDSFLIYSTITFFICVALLVATYFTKSGFAFIFSSIGCCLSWALWIIANSDDENFKNSYDGDIHNNVKGLSENWGS